MFGLEDQSDSNKNKPFVFDLEEELGSAKGKERYLEHVRSQMEKTKKFLREGKAKQQYDKLGAVLYGYTALMKIIARVEYK